MLAMAQRRTKYKRKKKVPTVKFDDMQRTNKVNVDAAMRSFEGPTKATLAIASEIADYSKHSFDHNIKTMENLLKCAIAGQSDRGADRVRQGGLRRLCQPGDQVGP
jgi:hypothetical protein